MRCARNSKFGLMVLGGITVGGLAAILPSVRPVAWAAEVDPATQPAVRSGYGGAVHAYFGGEYQRSYDELSQLIELGTEDPRVWFFRGLAASRLGRLDEALADFVTGSRNEAAARGNWDVPAALERIQGQDRLAIERQRRRARLVRMVPGGTDPQASAEQSSPPDESRADDADFLRPKRPEDVDRPPTKPFEEKAAGDEQPFEQGPAGDDPPAEEKAATDAGATPPGAEDAPMSEDETKDNESEEPPAERIPLPAADAADAAVSDN